MINLANLRFFYHVAKNMSFTLAASDLFVTQSAVTKRVKALEEECHLKFFGKRRGKTFLTEEGKVLYKYAKKIFDYEEQIETVLRDVRELKRGILRLALPKTFLDNAVNVLMDNFHHQYPNIRIKVDTGNSQEIIQGIRNNRYEIGNIAEIDDHPDIQRIPMSRSKIGAIVSPSHPFAGSASVTLEELSQEPLILREPGSGTRKLVMDLFEQNGHHPNILLETSNPEYLKQLVQRGDGVSLMAEMTIDREIGQGKLVMVPIKDHDIYLNLYIAYPKNVPLSLPAEAYLRIFSESELTS